MSRAESPLVLSRRFGPLFLTQLLGTFGGNFAKTAFVFLLTFGLTEAHGSSGTLVSAAAALFVAPFFLFSALAGQLADARDKARITRALKLVEVAVMLLGAYALAASSVWLMLATLFLLGTLSAFFGPIKYAIIPQHVGAGEILNATGLVEAGTFVAILLGQILGGVVSPGAAGAAMVAVALAGVAASRAIPAAPPLGAVAPPSRRFLTECYRVVAGVAGNRKLFATILAISWFWAVGAVFTSQLAVLVGEELRASNLVATLFLTIFSVGIIAGSLISNRLLGGEISPRYLPVAALAMTAFVGYFYWAMTFRAPGSDPGGLSAFLADASGWHMAVGLLGVSAAGGVFVVPLYALLQTLGDPARRSRDVAANNILNAVFMVAATAGSGALNAAGIAASEVLLLVGLLNLGVALYAATYDETMMLNRYVRWLRRTS